MSPEYRIGQRLSFKGNRCTVRYIGKVEGTDQDKSWLGVEWDDPTRGRHNGQHLGRRYFECMSSSQTAGSFVNLNSARADAEQSFVEAVRQKYATDLSAQPNYSVTNKPIVISSKTVEEVGFDKIRARLAQLHELRIVLVDELGINKAEAPGDSIRRECPKIVELDLGRNVFDGWGEIVRICKELDDLRTLKLNGNRLEVRAEELTGAQEAFRGVYELELGDMSLGWEDITQISRYFESITTLYASSNGLKHLTSGICGPSPPLFPPNLTSLFLEYNQFTSLSDLSDLQHVHSLEKLALKGNDICKVFEKGGHENAANPETKLRFTKNLRSVDLSYNAIHGWDFVDALADIFPGLRALRLSHNPISHNATNQQMPIWTVEESHMLAVARLGKLTVLNYSTISPVERTEAETYYLSQIAKAMAEVPEGLEHTVTSHHPRYAELCKIHGAPDVVRKEAETVDPNFLEARLIKFSFYMPPNTKPGQKEIITKERELPKGLDTYRVKGVVGRMFDERPLSLKLTWETGLFDPISGYDDVIDDDLDEDLTEAEQQLLASQERDVKQFGRFVEREVEIEDSTREVGNFIDGTEARVRVELR